MSDDTSDRKSNCCYTLSTPRDVTSINVMVIEGYCPIHSCVESNFLKLTGEIVISVTSPPLIFPPLSCGTDAMKQR